MERAAWVAVIIFSVLGFLLLLVSVAMSAIQQAAVGSMVTGFIVCAAGMAMAIRMMRRGS